MAGIAQHIDHTILSADATRAQIRQICQEALTHKFATVCVNSSHIQLAREVLGSPLRADASSHSGPVPIAVVGFPLGAASSESKAFEARTAVADGAHEIDMVIGVGLLRENTRDADELIVDDIKAVVKASKPAIVKVIIETSLLQGENEIRRACKLSIAGGAAFVKTSTGFGGGGAKVEHVRIMHEEVASQGLQVKASGGIRTTEDARGMLAAGASRLGCSASVAIVTGAEQGAQGGY
ncbi:hypothetical protein PYCC9005_005552 [Savitreella phatthalungensis]